MQSAFSFGRLHTEGLNVVLGSVVLIDCFCISRWSISAIAPGSLAWNELIERVGLAHDGCYIPGTVPQSFNYSTPVSPSIFPRICDKLLSDHPARFLLPRIGLYLLIYLRFSVQTGHLGLSTQPILDNLTPILGVYTHYRYSYLTNCELPTVLNQDQAPCAIRR